MFVANSHLDNSLSFMETEYMSVQSQVSANIRLPSQYKYPNFTTFFIKLNRIKTLNYFNFNYCYECCRSEKNLLKDTFLISSGTETISSAFSFYSGVDWWLEEKGVKRKLK